jgi:hypothetical protein
MRFLIDTNIILDIALKREPFYKESANSKGVHREVKNFGSHGLQK